MPQSRAFISPIPSIASSIAVRRGGDTCMGSNGFKTDRKLGGARADRGDWLLVRFQRPDSSIAARLGSWCLCCRCACRRLPRDNGHLEVALDNSGGSVIHVWVFHVFFFG